MITDQESLALLDEAQRIKTEVLTAEPAMALARLKELLAEIHPPYRRILERIIFDGFDIKAAIDRIKTQTGPEPKGPGEALFAWFQRLPRGVRYPLLAVVLPAIALFTVWQNLPESVQSGFFQSFLVPPRGLLVVTIETAGPVQSLPGGEFVFPLALRVKNPNAAPVHVEPGVLLLGDPSEPWLAGLVRFKTATLGAHASRQESLRVELIPLRPKALPAKTGERIPAGRLRLSVIGADGREESVACELDLRSLIWLPAP